jgi:hypothetical protein
VGPVAGYLCLEELGLIWLLWLLPIGVIAAVIAWHGAAAPGERRRVS